MSSVSSCSSRRSVATIASNASHERAALPEPPYTIKSSGRSATAGSRLFINIRRAASCGQPLQVMAAPRGALTWRLSVFMDRKRAISQSSRAEVSNLETYARVVKLNLQKSLLDFYGARALQRAARDRIGDRLDVGRRRPIR